MCFVVSVLSQGQRLTYSTNIPLLCAMLWIVVLLPRSLEFNRDDDFTHHPVTLLTTLHLSDSLLFKRKRSPWVNIKVYFTDKETGKANSKIKKMSQL